MHTDSTRRLFVAWRRPDKLTVPVGILSRRTSDGEERFEFGYLEAARKLEDFEPLSGLPQLGHLYRSQRLFPVFANRLMSPDRPDFSSWMSRLDLEPDADVFDVLARSGGVRMTDRLELFPLPERRSGEFWTRFLVRGISHVTGAEDVARRLREGATLAIRPEPDNPVNAQALLLDAQSGECVGYVPDFLAGVVWELDRLTGNWPRVAIHRVSPDAPPPMMVLVDMVAPWPSGFEPFSGPAYQLIEDLASTL
jgi:hypothetical protein